VIQPESLPLLHRQSRSNTKDQHTQDDESI
jgi:hypothetical protein